jgi:hypothetical protein
MIPELCVVSWVRTGCRAVFDSEHSLHLRRDILAFRLFERELTDWREQVTKWRHLRGLLCSHSDIVFIDPF